MEKPEQRSRREKKLTPALLAFFETKNSTGFFASVAAAQRDQEDLAKKQGNEIEELDVEEGDDIESSEKERKNTEDQEKSLQGIIHEKDIFKSSKKISKYNEATPKLNSKCEKQTKSVTRCYDAVCLICFDKNTLEDSMLSFSNVSKHMKRFHRKLFETLYEFQNITELKGKTLSFSSSLGMKVQKNKLKFEKAMTDKVNPYTTYVSAVSDFLVVQGISLDAVNCPQFEAMMESYRSLPKVYNYKIGRDLLRDRLCSAL